MIVVPTRLSCARMILRKDETPMKLGQRYRCLNPDCCCENEVTRASTKANTNPRSCERKIRSSLVPLRIHARPGSLGLFAPLPLAFLLSLYQSGRWLVGAVGIESYTAISPIASGCCNRPPGTIGTNSTRQPIYHVFFLPVPFWRWLCTMMQP